MRQSTHFPQFIAPSEAAASTFESLGSAEVVERAANGVRLRSGRAVVEVSALANDLFRVGLFADGRPVDYRSAAVATTDWPTLVYKQHLSGTRYFGCGERTRGLEKTTSRRAFWNVDALLGHTEALNNLYTSHAPLGQPAIYVRANTPVPLWPAMVHGAERPAETLTWLVFVAFGAASRVARTVSIAGRATA